MKSTGAAVRLQGVDKRFAQRHVLQGLELTLEAGEFVAVIGKSGSGKSTLLRLLCGLESPSRGSVRVEKDAARVVFQEPRLLPWRSVLANVMLGHRSEARARALLARVGLADRADDYPGVLSGGQRQRVALARALIHAPKLLLLDEPFGALDALTRIEAQQLVEALWAEFGFTSVLVTHDVSEAVLLSDRVLVIDAGRIVEDVRIDLPRPRARDLPELGVLTARLLESVMRKQAPTRASESSGGEHDFSRTPVGTQVGWRPAVLRR